MSRSSRRSEQVKHKTKKGKLSRMLDADRGQLRRHGRLLKRYEELPEEASAYFPQQQSDPAEW